MAAPKPTRRSKTAAREPSREEDEDFSVRDLLEPFRVTKGKDFRLKDHPTEDDREDFDFDKAMSKALLSDGVADLHLAAAALDGLHHGHRAANVLAATLVEVGRIGLDRLRAPIAPRDQDRGKRQQRKSDHLRGKRQRQHQRERPDDHGSHAEPHEVHAGNDRLEQPHGARDNEPVPGP